MNLIGRKYQINPETLRYERVTLSKRQRMVYSTVFVLGLLVLSVFLRNSYEKHFVTPRQVIYEHENEVLRASYVALNNTLHGVEGELSELRERDDHVYRSILSLDPVASTIREAGIGGSPTYTTLNGVRNPHVMHNVDARMTQISNKLKMQSSSLANVYNEAVNTQAFLACRPSINPISPADPTWMTSNYGYRNDPFTGRRVPHHGIDLAGPYGLDIHCTGDGVVKVARVSRYGYGKEVIVDHGFGYTTRYAHLQDIHVEVGQELKRGQVLGTMGNTGRSTGPHLHYEVMKDKRPVNPMYFFFENLDANEYALLTDRVKSPLASR